MSFLYSQPPSTGRGSASGGRTGSAGGKRTKPKEEREYEVLEIVDVNPATGEDVQIYEAQGTIVLSKGPDKAAKAAYQLVHPQASDFTPARVSVQKVGLEGEKPTKTLHYSVGRGPSAKGGFGTAKTEVKVKSLQPKKAASPSAFATSGAAVRSALSRPAQSYAQQQYAASPQISNDQLAQYIASGGPLTTGAAPALSAREQTFLQQHPLLEQYIEQQQPEEEEFIEYYY